MIFGYAKIAKSGICEKDASLSINAYSLHRLNNQIIKKTWDVTPVTHWQTSEQFSVWAESAIIDCWSEMIFVSIYCWSQTTKSKDWSSKFQPWNFFFIFLKKVKVVKVESQNMRFLAVQDSSITDDIVDLSVGWNQRSARILDPGNSRRESSSFFLAQPREMIFWSLDLETWE